MKNITPLEENVTPLEYFIETIESNFQSFKAKVETLEVTCKINLHSKQFGIQSLSQEYVTKYVGKYYTKESEDDFLTLEDIICLSEENFIEREHAIFQVLISENNLIDIVETKMDEILKAPFFTDKEKIEMLEKILLSYPLARIVLEETAQFLTRTIRD